MTFHSFAASLTVAILGTASLAQDNVPAAPSAPPPTTNQPTELTLPPGLAKAMEAAQKGDLEGAVKHLLAEAEKGNAEAMNALGEFYISGRGVKASVVEAQRWFQKAADAGNAMGMYNLARLLRTDAAGVKKDPEKAAFLIQSAAEAGIPAAQYEHGVALEAKLKGDGKGPLPDLTEPKKWYEKAAAQNQPDALLALARFADLGLAGEKSMAKGLDYTYKAAQAGSATAMNEMAVRYSRGMGVMADNVAAIGWYLAACELNHPVAMVNLGNCYETGNGVPKNIMRAGQYYAAAAKLGYAPAQFLIARMFEEGIGTEKNPVYAYVNFTRAAAGGVSDAAARRDAMKKALSAAQLKEAEDILAGKASAAAEPSADKKPAADPKKPK